MNIILLLIAAALLTLGHLFKTLRWEQFVSIYEDCSRKSLLNALAAGYLLNFCLPLHLGDFLRTWMAGRHMKNGSGLALATVFVDRVLDLLAAGLFFLFLTLIRPEESLRQTTLFYGVLLAALVAAMALAVALRDPLKRLIGRLCGLFNPGIERELLLFFWALISAFKDMRRKLNKGLLLAYSLLMWGCYFVSYALLGKLLAQSFPQILLMFFGSSNLRNSSLLTVITDAGNPDFTLGLSLYLLLPLLALLLLAAVRFRIPLRRKVRTVALIPQAERTEQLQFLRRYFAGSVRDYLQSYLAMNRDLTILRDLSAGSAATTMLCLRGESLFYRKYAFGEDGKKLLRQAQWIRAHSGALPLPQIIYEGDHADSYCYDMAYRPSGVNFFEYIHGHAPEESQRLLLTVLDTLKSKLYLDPRPADPETVEQYVAEKVQPRLRDILEAGELKTLTQSDTILINGTAYRNLPALLHLFRPDRLTELFRHDPVTQIHGDLTIENLIADPTMPGGFYLIDPNTGNVLNSPYLDYSKLLQSLHGKYEFLQMVPNCEVSLGSVEFLFSYTTNYTQLYDFYDRWLAEHFTPEQVRSIYCHELIHWLRLMPYKLKKLGKHAAIYYAAFILVLNDVARRLEDTP